MRRKNNNNIPVVEAELVPGPAAATPTEYFEYNEETMRNESRVPVPTAPTLSTLEDDSPDAQQHDVARKARYGSAMGKIQADRERQRIREQSANDQSKPYLESHRISVAGEIAKQRAKELNVTEDKYFDESGLLAARNGGSNANKSKKYSVGEYEVSQYNVEEYSCTEYQTTEYKSVYEK
mmetsp:Transcript_16900/g.21384  ORF Transcript_16900/g.21384 Transcript_16900/m.21384 type:complete len:180 (-) Transcript_16900:147-686(-)|eukprot:CAMPEP_0203652788 /NCGR_PEP_ID=MMETSP0088-20131115/30909_1 /ASSEMBLY_ACC=CAM_ASM_001087 /TAXON_ID=426623 /ORGANISM="Chaetoceros affinis, Strain CCMP159" /LENGTH=179 /DNA_ID=CAMNT_0050512449 /DNA_START=112 /DNA_END=651 /DNA_ORIENTATION=-